MPLIYQSIPYVGQIQHRARGTVLGSICHGDPTSELPLCFLALNGKIHLKSKKGLRSISANDFYLGPLLTSKNSNEVAIKLELPVKKIMLVMHLMRFQKNIQIMLYLHLQ